MGFEAKLAQAGLLKKLIDSIKDLVSDANWECSGTGINLQAMDTSHVSLVQLVLKSDGFANFHCDRNLALGLNMGNMAKILKCATNEDSITIKADDTPDAVTFVFESEKKDKHSVFDLKLSNIDAENLGIPETDYSVTIQMPSGEFQKICKDLQQIGDTVTISATKSGVKFTASGDIGTGSVQLRQNAAADKKEDAVIIDMSEPVSLTFALKYLNMFTKSTSLSDKVVISMSKESPLLVNYNIGEMGHIKFYLAPKVDDGEQEQAPEGGEKATKEEVEDDE